MIKIHTYGISPNRMIARDFGSTSNRVIGQVIGYSSKKQHTCEILLKNSPLRREIDIPQLKHQWVLMYAEDMPNSRCRLARYEDCNRRHGSSNWLKDSFNMFKKNMDTVVPFPYSVLLAEKKKAQILVCWGCGLVTCFNCVEFCWTCNVETYIQAIRQTMQPEILEPEYDEEDCALSKIDSSDWSALMDKSLLKMAKGTWEL